MSIEEKLHEKLDWLMVKHIDANKIISDIIVICKQEIAEACKKQREICAKEVNLWTTSGKDKSIYSVIIDSPSPKESEQ